MLCCVTFFILAPSPDLPVYVQAHFFPLSGIVAKQTPEDGRKRFNGNEVIAAPQYSTIGQTEWPHAVPCHAGARSAHILCQNVMDVPCAWLGLWEIRVCLYLHLQPYYRYGWPTVVM